MCSVVLFGLVLYCSCLPSTGDVPSAFSSPHGMLHSPPLSCHLSSLLSQSLSCFSTRVSLSLGGFGALLGLGVCPHLHLRLELGLIPRRDFLQAFSLLVVQTFRVLTQEGPAPEMVDGRGGRVMLAQITRNFSFPHSLSTLSLHIGSIHVCMSLSPPFFFYSLLLPFPLLRYLKYSQ